VPGPPIATDICGSSLVSSVIVTILQVAFHYKLSFRSCTDQDTWSCVSGDCGTESVELSIVDEEGKEWCQREGVMSREVSSNAVFQLRQWGSHVH
uniref:Uncharacterized protein n=1 Tax=Pundamilia nyererei TaxID=303518 RepID=A0A3B4GDT3_9CICH